MAIVDDLKVLNDDMTKTVTPVVKPLGETKIDAVLADPTAISEPSQSTVDGLDKPEDLGYVPQVNVGSADAAVLATANTPIIPYAERQAGLDEAYQISKARQEAITRRQQNLGENGRSIERFFSADYSTAQKADKFGWNGGQLMDAQARNKFMQAQLNADIYQRNAYVEGEFNNKLAIAREYKALKQDELANQAYNDAINHSLSRAQITGQYISPEAEDMISQYKMAAADTENPEQAEAVRTQVEDYFIAMGLGEPILDEGGQPMLDAEGNPQMTIDPAVINGLIDLNDTLASRQQDFDKFLFEAGQEEATNMLELQYNTDLNEDGQVGGFNSPVMEGASVQDENGNWMFWNNDAKEWMDGTEYDVRKAQLEQERLDAIEAERIAATGEETTTNADYKVDPETQQAYVKDINGEWVPSTYVAGFSLKDAQAFALSSKELLVSGMDTNNAYHGYNEFMQSNMYTNQAMLESITANGIVTLKHLTTRSGQGLYDDTYEIGYIDAQGVLQTQNVLGLNLLTGAALYGTDFGHEDVLSAIYNGGKNYAGDKYDGAREFYREYLKNTGYNPMPSWEPTVTEESEDPSINNPGY
jgi:hypothetical protein